MIYLLLFQVGLVCSLLPVNFLTAKVETGDVPSTSKGKGKMKQCWTLVIVDSLFSDFGFKYCNEVYYLISAWMIVCNG